MLSRLLIAEKGSPAKLGTYSFSSPKAADGQETCAIITVAPNELMEPIHNRMPAILERGAEEAWLDPELTDSLAVISLLQPYPAGKMEAYPVSARVGSPKHDDPALIKSIVDA